MFDELFQRSVWLSSYDKIGEIVISAAVFYLFVIALVRVLGKRTTNQLNNFDWIITFAIGSLFASGILLKDVAIVDSLAAILTLAILQWFTTKMVLRSKVVAKLVKSDPTLLVHKGEYIDSAMERTRISQEEICAVLRNEGYESPDDVNWVILETNGTFSVIPRSEKSLSRADTMGDVTTPNQLPKPSQRG
ncbi:DUF421 domain-containing protein [Erythrobacter aureus]|uniref:DUF421 domain-containing protein n=1 Tax=Erythrobacter aureus TaxID=2182384 RepID=UPI003A94B61D